MATGAGIRQSPERKERVTKEKVVDGEKEGERRKEKEEQVFKKRQNLRLT